MAFVPQFATPLDDEGFQPSSLTPLPALTEKQRKERAVSNFILASPARIQRTVVGSASVPVSWDLIASSTSTGSEALFIKIDDNRLYDINKYPNDPIAIDRDRDTSVVTIVDSAAIRVDSIRIVSPAGATDDTVSTEQEFRLKAWISFSGSTSPSNRKAELLLPLGAGFFTPDSTIFTLGTAVTDTVSWVIFAPTTISELANFEILVRAEAVDANSGVIRRDTTNIPIVVQRKANLELTRRIVRPNGAIDQTVSTFQQFEVEVGIINRGQAGTNNQSEVEVSLPAGFSFAKSSIIELDTLLIGQGSPEIDTIYTSSAVTANPPDTIHFRITRAADDENTNQPADTLLGSLELPNMRIVQRADLQLSTLYPDTVNRNFDFQIKATVNNIGIASVLPTNGQVWVIIDTSGTDFILTENDSASTTLGDTITWNLQSGSQFGPKQLSVGIASIEGLYDQNNYQDTTVFVSKSDTTLSIEVLETAAITIEDLYITTNAVQNQDTVIVSTSQDSILIHLDVSFSPVFSQNRTAVITNPPGFGIDRNQVQTNIGDVVEWYLTARSTPFPDYIKIPVTVQATAPSNSITLFQNDSVYIKVDQAARLRLSASVKEPAGARDDTVSFGQTFTYQALVQNLSVTDVDGPGELIAITENSLNIMDNPIKSFNIDDTLTWQIGATPNTQAANLLKSIEDLKIEARQLREQKMTMADEGNNPFLTEKLNQITSDINNLYGTLAEVVDSGFVTIRYNDIPNDVNTGKPANTDPDSVQRKILILEEPSITVDNDSIPGKVSTGQVFTVKVDVTNTGELVNQMASLYIPFAGFDVPDSASKPITNGTVSWQVTAPATIDSSMDIDNIKIKISGLDPNQNRTYSDSINRSLRLDRKALLQLDLRIISPSSALDGRLAYGQSFTVRGTVTNAGDANILGNGTIKLSRGVSDILILNNTDSVQTFNSDTLTRSWTLQMPGREVTSNISLGFQSLPYDENTGSSAAVDPNASVSSISVSTVDKTIIAMRDNTIQPDSINYSQNTTNIPIIAIRLENSDAGPYDLVNIDNMKLTLRERSQPGVPLVNPSAHVNRIRIVNKAYYVSQPENSSIPTEFADITISDVISDTMTIAFNLDTLNLEPDSTETLVIYLDLNPNSSNISFSLKVEEIYAYLKTEDNSRENKVRVIDRNGTEFAQSNQGLSSLISVVSTNEDDKFSNYPNPFGQDEDFTSFAFFAPEAGNAEIKIYTLMGGLVRTLNAGTVEAQQFYSRKVSWYGKNQKGHLVLNGVYIAVLSINGNSYYKTKIAFIK